MICHNIVLGIIPRCVKIPEIDARLKWVSETCDANSDHPIFRNGYRKSNDFLQCIYYVTYQAISTHSVTVEKPFPVIERRVV